MQEVKSKDISMHRYERLTLIGAEGPGVQLTSSRKTHAVRKVSSSRKADDCSSR